VRKSYFVLALAALVALVFATGMVRVEVRAEGDGDA